MLEARLKKRFAASEESRGFALDVDFSAGPGIDVLFGPSGAGKSLTLDLLAGFSRPSEGRILLNDRLLFDAATGVSLSPQQRRCAYVFQNHALFPHMSIRQNLEFAASTRPRLERHRKINQLLEAFQLNELAGRRPRQLSGGQQQRASIARALVVEPAILLLDEPSRGLDASLRADLYEILAQVRDEFRAPMLLVSHDLDECFTLADRMHVMLDGRIVQSGAPRDVLEQPATAAVADLLGLYNLLPAEVKLLDPGANRSKLRWGNVELEGPYYPARMLGDRVTVCVRRDALRASPKMGKPERGQLVLPLEGTAELARSLLLLFPGGLVVEMPLEEFALNSHHKEWVVTFPTQSLRVI